ncbi:hypothetical protein PAMA_017251 [Pampus argenteus]
MDQTSHPCSGDDEEATVVIGQGLLRLQNAVVMAMCRARHRALQGFAVFSVVLLLLWVAMFLYGSFYYSYMPTAAFSTSVHYYYRTDCDSAASFLCSYPVANISLMKNKKHVCVLGVRGGASISYACICLCVKHTSIHRNYPRNITFKNIYIQVLTFGQAYQMSLQLEMPDSPANQDLGMFMIKTTCFSQDGVQVASSARSSMLRYRSDLLRTMGTLLFLPAFLTGVTEQKQTLEVELFSDFTDDPYAPSVTAVIAILSNKVQIYSSQLYIHAHFTGIRYLLFYHPFLSALVGVSSNFTFLSVLFILSYVRLLLRVEWRPEQFRTDGLLSQRDNSWREIEVDPAAGTAELLGPLQITPTKRGQKKRHTHFGGSTEQQNRQTLCQSEINESDAA